MTTWKWPLAALSYHCAVFWLSSARRDLPFQVFTVQYADKIIHALVFGGLAFCVAKAFSAAWPELTGWRRFVMVVTVTACSGLSDELHQAYVPGRSASFYDAVADVFGACVAGAGMTSRRG